MQSRLWHYPPRPFLIGLPSRRNRTQRNYGSHGRHKGIILLDGGFPGLGVGLQKEIFDARQTSYVEFNLRLAARSARMALGLRLGAPASVAALRP